MNFKLSAAKLSLCRLCSSLWLGLPVPVGKLKRAHPYPVETFASQASKANTQFEQDTRPRLCLSTTLPASIILASRDARRAREWFNLSNLSKAPMGPDTMPVFELIVALDAIGGPANAQGYRHSIEELPLPFSVGQSQLDE